MSALLEANLRALSVREPEIAGAVRAAAADPELRFVASASGVPVAVRRDGAALHSRVDPLREARRLADTLPSTGVAVFLGLGGGYAPAALLARGTLFAAVVVERSASTLRTLFEHVDLSRLLADPRLTVAIDPAGVTAAVLGSWAPALMGEVRTVPLRPWCEASRDFFDRAARAVESARDLAAADWAAQARFGRRWFVNTLLNLPAAQLAGLSIPPVRSAIVTGAGPSLDRFAVRLPEARRGTLLAATDTSLPALLARGVVPDLVVSIDCQHYGYHHVMGGIPADLPLLLDLASPPALVRSSRSIGFFASAHPLARWLSRHWRALPAVETAGGNVTHAAVSAAYALGARDIRLAGVDFSCPLGNPYARGTWLHTYFRSRESRCDPAEGSLLGMAIGGTDTIREPMPGGIRYTTPLLAGYRRAFERLAGSLEATVIDEWCLGPRLRVPKSTGPSPARWDGGFRMGTAREGWRDVLVAYRELVAGLRPPAQPLASWWHALEPAGREAWLTLLPLLPGLPAPPSADRPGLLEAARQWALARVSGILPVDHRGVSHE